MAYLRLFGPATPGDVAGFLGSSAGELRRVWPADALPRCGPTSSNSGECWPTRARCWSTARSLAPGG
ncbi:hypothetical protein [Micromonospora sp. NPDC005299]|uniref:hypothetical protein n=1 Tax=Micromonospora sp. NPDC005299 TaxID=3364231 RepID=UPI00367E20D9